MIIKYWVSIGLGPKVEDQFYIDSWEWKKMGDGDKFLFIQDLIMSKLLTGYEVIDE